MRRIIFFDTEVSEKSKTIKDFGAISDTDEVLHTTDPEEFNAFMDESLYLCGHNVINHDVLYIKPLFPAIESKEIIDTLYLSPLLFPKQPYHNLVKDDKLLTDQLNNPVNDAKKARDLLNDEITAFIHLDESIKRIYYALLYDKRGFASFYNYLDYEPDIQDLNEAIARKFSDKICGNAPLAYYITQYPIALAYGLALINTDSVYSITPPWVLMQYPEVEVVIHGLRNTPCLHGCIYCKKALNPLSGLKQYFGFDSYRTYDGAPLQENAVRAALEGKSLLAVFPTGGGKSITFQVPALMSGRNEKGLTVVISPLQSLMKDQVDNLERSNVTDAVTINGLLDPIERADAIARVQNGTAHILYISPESLRSKSIERLLLGRSITRFVIDEAHCFSAWGQDFRVDYLYIGDFIKNLYDRKQLKEMIPVSCFTATAKQNVVYDIKDYFIQKLDLELELYTASAQRKNLHYRVIPKGSEEEKYGALRLFIESKNCPTIVYVSRTKLAEKLAARLSQDGYNAAAYHGKMDKKEKSNNQDAFIRGDIQIMVATSAFGMGVDKKDVGLVIHFEISDSLENYVQEAGRAGRDASIEADCYVLYDDEDLNKHFNMLSQSKLNINEIQQIWKAIKDLTKFRYTVSHSALEIARKAGWDDTLMDIETRVRTAIAALEESGYIKRGQNMPRVYADSILAHNMAEAGERIRQSSFFNKTEQEMAIRLIKSLISAKNRKKGEDEIAESRVDYLADHLGLTREMVIHVIGLMKQEGILADAKDLVVYVGENNSEAAVRNLFELYKKLEFFLLEKIPEEENTIPIKALNELAETEGLKKVTTDKIINLFNFWAIRNWIHRQTLKGSKNHVVLRFKQPKDELTLALTQRIKICAFILDYIYHLSSLSTESMVQFSVLDIKNHYDEANKLYNEKTSLNEVEEALLYLGRIGALKIEGGFMVIYNAMHIERLELDNKIRYKKEDYSKLELFYQQKMQMIHIVGEYATKMLEDYQAALTFVNDYFSLNYDSFLVKYFKGSRKQEIGRNLTPQKFKKLFGELSPKQLSIINDNESKYIVVAAGPGSGKTRILVHKLASLLLMEDVKHEQLLMVTFSRAAATEFKKRLYELIGTAAYYVEVKTFHSYCFDLLGRIGNLEKSGNIVAEAAMMIRSGEVEPSRITKAVMVIDEAQDMDQYEFDLIRALMEQNNEMRIIAVGDDDQNIYEFRGSKSKYMKAFLKSEASKLYELIENYRSGYSLTQFTNGFLKWIPDRLKTTAIRGIQKTWGKVDLHYYQDGPIMAPMVKTLLEQGLSSNTCILTNTNHEALQVTGMLVEAGIPARLIQSADYFNLYQLDEIRFFLQQLDMDASEPTIDFDTWQIGKSRFQNHYKTSGNYELVQQLIEDFEKTSWKIKYKTDFLIYIRESKLEDFYGGQKEMVYVSTMHKAKGREFDQVIILLNQFNLTSTERKRLLYVAMTRAKAVLSIHYNGNELDKIFHKLMAEPSTVPGDGYQIPEASRLYIREAGSGYGMEDQLILHLSHKEVYLDYFYKVQPTLEGLLSGDLLLVDHLGCRTKDGQLILKFSRSFKETLDAYYAKGYQLHQGKVNFVFYWKKEGTTEEIKILLPEIWLKA